MCCKPGQAGQNNRRAGEGNKTKDRASLERKREAGILFCEAVVLVLQIVTPLDLIFNSGTASCQGVVFLLPPLRSQISALNLPQGMVFLQLALQVIKVVQLVALG